MLSHDNKQRTGCRFRWAALVVPLVLVLITASTRFITHPVAFDLFFSPASESWSHALAQTSDWRLHKRHPSQQDNPSSPLPSATFNILTPTVTNPQSIPTAPFTPPVLPTPFPQPYDSQLTLNFSSATCLRFFTNMTQSDAFRKCRPFSLLSQTSATFINVRWLVFTLVIFSIFLSRLKPIWHSWIRLCGEHAIQILGSISAMLTWAGFPRRWRQLVMRTWRTEFL